MTTRVVALIGVTNGFNMLFTTPELFVAGTFRLFHNGVLYEPSDDVWGYTELSQSSVKLIRAPRAGDVLQGLYEINQGSASPGELAPGVQNMAELLAVPQAERQDRQVRLVEDENAFFRFDSSATVGGFAPLDVDDGRWFKVGDQLLTMTGTPYDPAGVYS